MGNRRTCRTSNCWDCTDCPYEEKERIDWSKIGFCAYLLVLFVIVCIAVPFIESQCAETARTIVR